MLWFIESCGREMKVKKGLESSIAVMALLLLIVLVSSEEAAKVGCELYEINAGNFGCLTGSETVVAVVGFMLFYLTVMVALAMIVHLIVLAITRDWNPVLSRGVLRASLRRRVLERFGLELSQSEEEDDDQAETSQKATTGSVSKATNKETSNKETTTSQEQEKQRTKSD